MNPSSLPLVIFSLAGVIDQEERKLSQSLFPRAYLVRRMVSHPAGFNKNRKEEDEHLNRSTII